MWHLVILATMFSSLAFGQIESVINFNGQNADIVKIDQAVSLVRQLQVEVPSTCTRQVPYESYECRDVTRYRQDCSWVPSAQQCWEEPERVCRTVTRTRQECHNGPGRRVCTDIPVREVCTDRPDRQECTTVTRHREECSTGSSREVCHDVPSREVCTNRPTREVCRPGPGGRQVCSTVGGGRVCNQVGGGRQCRTVPGERTCRQVPYQDRQCRTVDGGRSCTTVGGGQTCHDVEGPRVCRDVPYHHEDCTTVQRRQCREIPGHNECRDIPYTEQVCAMETRYNTESYACTRSETVNQTVVKQLKGEINVKFLTNGLVEEFPLTVLLNQPPEGSSDYSLKLSLNKEPKVLVIAREAGVEAIEGEKEINLEGEVILEILEPAMVAPAFPQEFSQVSLNQETRHLTMIFKGQVSASGSVEVNVERRNWLGRRSVVAHLKADYPSEKVKVDGDKLIIDLSGELESKLNKLSVDLKMSAAISVDGVLLNTKKPTTEAAYEGLMVTLE